MLLLLNIMGVVLFGAMMVLGFKWMRRYLVNGDWFSIGALCSLYLLFFPILLGAVFGIVNTFPLGMQKHCRIILIPLGKFALYGSIFGLILFVSCGAARNITANAKARIKKYKKKPNQR